MNIHPFIFSNNLNYRLGRHSLFWFLWILYYAVMSAIIMYSRWGFARSFFASFVEVAETTPIDMCFCYFVIYYLFPKFLYKGKYISMLFLWWAASIFAVFLYEVNAILVVPHIRAAFGMAVEKDLLKYFWQPSNLWNLFSLFTQLNMEGCVAASIKLGKLWYVKQQEVDLIKQEKQKIDPHAEHGLIQPGFLTDLLTRMETIANERPVIAAQSMKKIRHLLLYILYENSSSKVPLHKEFALLQEYIDLEKITTEEEITVNTVTNGSPSYETIAPFILLPLVENAFKQVRSYSLKNPVLNINLSFQNEIIDIKLNWDKPIETSSLSNGRNIILQNISKRLQLIYPQSHDLKMMIETEKIFIELRINLKKAIN